MGDYGGNYGVGQPVPREEDPYLLRGAGRYVDDVRPAGQARAYVLRSPHSHAKIRSVDASQARAAPGVLLVLTGHDPEVRALGMQEPAIPRKRRDGSPAFFCPQPLLAHDRVRYIGDYVAFVVAETLDQAKDAAELIQVDYEELPAVVSTELAVKPGAPAVWEKCPDNQAFLHEAGNKAAVEAAFAKAGKVVRHKFVINRLTTNSMEPRGCLAEYDDRDDRYTVRCTCQGPHTVRRVLATRLLKVPETQVRVIAENVGGGFGMKGGIYPEYALAAFAAKLTGRPVKWIGERSESILSDEHCRDNVTEAELALGKDGKFLGFRARTLANIGAYYNSDRNQGPPTNNIGVLAGTYTTPACHVEVIGVLTNTMMTGPYRGAGRPEAAYVIETMVELAAAELGIDPVELRRRNTIPPAAMPFKTGLVYTYDCGDFGKNLEDCLKLADHAGFAGRRADSARRGKLRGLGLSNTVEASNAGLIEYAQIRFDPTGTVTMLMGTHDHGQGHATAYRQILADKLGLDPKRVRFKYGDTDEVAIGTGTFGSRSMANGGTALVKASLKIIEKGKRIAAHMLETAEGDISFEAGKFTIAGTDRSVSLIEVAKTAFLPAKLPKGFEPGFDESATHDGGLMTFPNGCHIAEVEIDRETGVIELVRYSAVDDVGHMINPLLVEGQLHGGIVQGIGQALMENIAYDAGSGQILSGSFMDYAMPRADVFCRFDAGENEVPTKTNPLGVKGAGEGGTVGALAAVMIAINHALASVGAPYVQMPCTAEKVWRALQAAKKS
ncbi:MAG: xanthine dehydrogenase family protein molybdopterin-binding subunit [Alphaproteobacteria bacterium]|nr:xanthine dehydrogenase family protein molybdopterin-binding subunit [Alphaproteobacteria bacterium]